MSGLFSTPEQISRQNREAPRFPMSPEVVMAALGGSGPGEVDVGWLSSSPNHYDQSNNNNNSSSSDDDSSNISPFHDVFPKREIFDSFDLSSIPLSLFPGSIPAPLDLSTSAAADIGLGTAFTPGSISPTSALTPASSTFSSVSSSSPTSATYMSNPLGFDAAPFGQTSGFYSLHGSSSPMVDTQGSRTDMQAAPLSSAIATSLNEQSIRAPMNILSGDERLPSGSCAMTEHKSSMNTTTPPDRKLSLPQSLFHTPRHTPRKRKSTGSAASSTSTRSSSSPPPQSSGSGSGSSSTSPSTAPLQPRKSTHNMIEKRYRTNINDKIAALRDAVPSLRLMVHRMEREGQVGFINGGGLLGAGESILMDDVDVSSLEAEQHLLGGLAPAHKLNKATVLSKATEYIAHLERNNAMLMREVEQMRSSVNDAEIILMHQPQQQQHAHQHVHQHRNTMAYGVGIW